MSFAAMTNYVTVILCVAVLIQCTRMMRSLDAFRRLDLQGTAAMLDRSTGEARRVLGEIKTLLEREAGPKIAMLEEAKGVADELAVMIGIANASADRMLDAGRAGALPPAIKAARKPRVVAGAPARAKRVAA